MLKQIQFSGRDDQGNVLCQPLWSSGLEKVASEWRGSNLHPTVRRYLQNDLKRTDKGIYVLVNALGAWEYWGSNVNGDAFPEKALVHAPSDWEGLSVTSMKGKSKDWPYGFPTFMHAHPFKHHVNKDPSRAFGHVELAVWNPKMHRVELVVYLDRAKCEKHGALDVYERIERGEFPDVSMGCKVPYDRCSICDKKSKTQADYCEHAKTMMNKILPDGRKVCVINDFPRFFDISFVFIGADKSAKMLAKLAHVGNQVCMGDFCTVPRLSAEVAEKFSSVEVDDYQLDPQSALSDFLSDLRAHRTGGVQAGGGLEKSASSPAKGGELTKDHREAGWREYSFNALDREGVLEKFFGDIRDNANVGHSFTVVVDPDEGGRKYGFDGDGGMMLSPLEKNANDPIKKKILVQDVPIWIEWPKGSTREYKDHKTGKIHYRKHMEADYGYIPGTQDADGEEIDVYVGPDREARTAWVVKQMKKDGKSFDENKVMIGYASKAKAKASYDHHMGDAKERFGGMHPVPVSSLRVLFSENGDGKEKAGSGCGCGGSCGCSEADFSKLASAFGHKSASHAKLSELIKIIPGGPFRKAHLPKLEKAEGKLPNEVLDQMAKCGMDAALSTSAIMGIVLKPEEFQRIVLTKIGEEKMANDLDEAGVVFSPSDSVDETFSMKPGVEDEGLKQSLLPYMAARSVASPLLEKRASVASRIDSPPRSFVEVPGDALLDKVAELYNGYRRSLVKKAAFIENKLVTDPHLLSAWAGRSVVEAFAGGIEKTAHASVLGPESLAYLVGAYHQNRDFHAEALAQSGVNVAA